MAKKKSKVVDAISEPDDDSEDSENEGTDSLELLQVDVGDIVKLKQVLDEAVFSALLDDPPLVEEDYTLENIKLLLMSLACACAAVGQFSPLPFPESRAILGACCIAYFTLSGILQLVLTFIERDTILITKPPKNGDYKIKNKGLRIRSDLPRYDEHYSVTIEYDKMENSPFVKEAWSVGKFFDGEGMFDEVYFTEATQNLLKRLEKGQYDTYESKKNQ